MALALAMSMPACRVPHRDPYAEVKTPCVGKAKWGTFQARLARGPLLSECHSGGVFSLEPRRARWRARYNDLRTGHGGQWSCVEPSLIGGEKVRVGVDSYPRCRRVYDTRRRAADRHRSDEQVASRCSG